MAFEKPDFLKLAIDSMESGQNDPRVKWHESARPDQRQPPGKWDTWLVRGGRGSGKTHTGAFTMVEWILNDNDSVGHTPGDWGIVGPTYQSAWTVCVEGESGILAAFGTNMSEIKANKSKYVSHAWRSHGEIRLRSGDKIYVDSANDGADRVQGKNLKGVWCDELGMWTKWEQAWDEAIKYACRKSGSRKVCTTTPKVSRPAAKLIRRLLQDPDIPVAKLKTIDNKANLSDAFIDSVVGRAKGTRLEKQELEGELLDDISGALWTWPLLEETSVRSLPQVDGKTIKLTKVCVGVDPSDGKESGDEQAYTVVGLGEDRHLYVLESWGDRISPNAFLRKAVAAAVRWDAQLVVEHNHGRGYLDLALQQVQKDMGTDRKVSLVQASKGKRTRSEPVAALYERKFVHHVKPTRQNDEGDYVEDESFYELEDQMCSFTGAINEKSPDRLDSLVWAVSPFLNYAFGRQARRPQRVHSYKAAVPEPRPIDQPVTGRHSYVRNGENGRVEPWTPPEVVPPARRHVRQWSASGGQLLLHSCGMKVKDIAETLSRSRYFVYKVLHSYEVSFKIGRPQTGWRYQDGYLVANIQYPDGRWGLMLQHVLVMEQYLERPLIKGENVHHKNGVRDDNRIENLELWNTSQPPGQRICDKIEYAVGILRLYAPELLRKTSEP